MGAFVLDMQERFPHLPAAPIVEAVIHWQARAAAALDRDELLQLLKDELPDYPHAQPQHQIRFEGSVGQEGSSLRQDGSWHGHRLESEDRRQVAQFNRNGFVFSRLSPYQKWEQFVSEAKRLWRLYERIAEPSEIERLGVRFINRIAPVELNKLHDYLTLPPQCPDPLDLPIVEFLHRTRFDVPGHAYALNVIQTVQHPVRRAEGFGLIVDVDVFTTASIGLDEAILDMCLKELRWLKNKAFFTFLSSDAIERFKGSGT